MADEKELEAKITELATQVATLTTEMEAKDKALGEKDKALADLQEKVGKPATPAATKIEPAPAPAGATPEELAQLEAKNKELTVELIKRDFPQITDFSVVHGQTPEELRANAEKIAKMIPVGGKAQEGTPTPKPGDPIKDWAKVPGAGTLVPADPGKQKREESAKALVEAHANGDAKGVLDQVFAQVPGFFGGAKK